MNAMKSNIHWYSQARAAVVPVVMLVCLLTYWNIFDVKDSSQHQANAASARQRKMPKKLIFLHYHKTGHDLSRTLAISGFQVSFKKFKRTNPAQFVIDACSPSAESSAPILVAAAVDFGTQWNDWWYSHPIQMVHFVRDPVDWTVSAYLYHVQQPIPKPERVWMRHPQGPSACHRNMTNISQKHILSNDTLSLVAELCRNLTTVSLSWASQLEVLSEQDGIRLEAARGILGSDHGDLALMMQQLEASRHVPDVITFRLSDFTDSKQYFQSSVRMLCIFGQDILHTQNRTINRCVKDSLKHGWIDKEKIHSEHITSNQRSTSELYRLKQLLLDDPVLGQPLRNMQQFLQQVYDEQRHKIGASIKPIESTIVLKSPT